jgi:hypothetical protein
LGHGDIQTLTQFKTTGANEMIQHSVNEAVANRTSTPAEVKTPWKPTPVGSPRTVASTAPRTVAGDVASMAKAVEAIVGLIVGIVFLAFAYWVVVFVCGHFVHDVMKVAR